MVAHIVPIRRSARDLFAQCIGVLILMPAKTPQAPSVELVHRCSISPLPKRASPAA
jgi:hypothetical protein